MCVLWVSLFIDKQTMVSCLDFLPDQTILTANKSPYKLRLPICRLGSSCRNFWGQSKMGSANVPKDYTLSLNGEWIVKCMSLYRAGEKVWIFIKWKWRTVPKVVAVSWSPLVWTEAIAEPEAEAQLCNLPSFSHPVYTVTNKSLTRLNK